MDTDPTKVEDCCRPTKGRKDLQGEFAEHGSREALLEVLFASVADAIFLAEPDGRIIDANPAARAMLGYAREELLGAPRPPTGSTRRGRGKPTRTGQTGTPSTWCASRPAKSCRNDRRLARAFSSPCGNGA